MTYDLVTRNLQDTLGKCFLDEDGISSSNTCRISGFFNKCPAGSSLSYAIENNSVDATLVCPLDSVAQSDWIEASQKGLCECEASLLDANCDILQEEMDCECFACPPGTKLGFAYSCKSAIVGPCTSFDCYGNCNEKYDPGNLVNDRETFAPTIYPSIEDKNEASSSRNNGTPNNHVMGTAFMVVALFRMIM